MNFAGIALFTVVEDVFLVAWLALARATAQAARVLAAPVLAIGLFVEHVIATAVKNGDPLINLRRFDYLRTLPLGRLAVNAVLETGIWVVWLLLWPIYPFALFGVGIPLYASLFLFPALVVEHSLTDNIFHNRPLFANLLNPRVLRFSLSEFVGATAWLGLIGAGQPLAGVLVLVIFQFLEHLDAIAVGRRP